MNKKGLIWTDLKTIILALVVLIIIFSAFYSDTGKSIFSDAKKTIENIFNFKSDVVSGYENLTGEEIVVSEQDKKNAKIIRDKISSLVGSLEEDCIFELSSIDGFAVVFRKWGGGSKIQIHKLVGTDVGSILEEHIYDSVKFSYEGERKEFAFLTKNKVLRIGGIEISLTEGSVRKPVLFKSSENEIEFLEVRKAIDFRREKLSCDRKKIADRLLDMKLDGEINEGLYLAQLFGIYYDDRLFEKALDIYYELNRGIIEEGVLVDEMEKNFYVDRVVLEDLEASWFDIVNNAPEGVRYLCKDENNVDKCFVEACIGSRFDNLKDCEMERLILLK